MMPKEGFRIQDTRYKIQDTGQGMDITIYIKIKNEWLKYLC